MNDFPYTNFHDLNLDWILKEFKSLGGRVDEIERILADDTPMQELVALFYAIAFGTDVHGNPLPDTSEFYHNNCEYFKEIAEQKALQAGTSATQAAASVTQCQTIQGACQAILDSIPEDYTQLSQDVNDLKSAIDTNIVNITEKTNNLFSPTNYFYSQNTHPKFEYSTVNVIADNEGTNVNSYVVVKIANASDFSAGDTISYGFKTGQVQSKSMFVLCLFTVNDGVPSSRTSLWGSGNLTSDTTYDRTYTFTSNDVTSGKVLCVQLYLGYQMTIAVNNTAVFKDIYVSKTGSAYIPARIPVDVIAREKSEQALNASANTIKSGTRISGSGVLSDANNANQDYIYTIATDGIVSNLPANNDTRGTLLTYCFDPVNRAAGTVQIFVDRLGEMFCRILFGGSGGTWRGWHNLLNAKTTFSGIGMFERFGVIGDSFASGFIYTPTDTSGSEHYALSWGQILARQEGITCTNYSKGGYNTYAFVQQNDSDYNTYGLGKVLADINNGSACGLYLLCLGINDSNSSRTFGDKTGGLNYLGSSSDIKTNPANNENSFWGNYGRIISAIKTASPNSRIVMCNFRRIPTTATSAAYDSYRSAIASIANYFSIPSINLDNDSFFTSSYYMDQMEGSHPTAPQNVGYANAINRLICRTIMDNYDYFKEYVGV